MSETPTGNNNTDIRDLYTKVRQVRDLLKKSVPRGLIAIWSGYVADIPIGWTICNGENGTPDLRSKFVYGATDDDDNDDTGGEATHTLTTAEIPAHTHTNPGGGNYLTAGTGTAANLTTGGGSFVQNAPQSAGGGAAHNNLPPYLKKAFIMFMGVDTLIKAK